MNILEKNFGDEKRWVNWFIKIVDGKETKVPRGSTTDPNTWSTLKNLPKNDPNTGIVFTQDRLLLGIDLDKCIENNSLTPVAQAVFDQADTYTEISPSGTGLHLFLKLTAPLILVANKKKPFECYTSERYFTVTNKSYHQTPKDIRTVTPEQATSILSIMGYPWGKKPAKKSATTTPSSTPTSISPSILEKMFASKNGAQIQDLYNGDISKYNNDESSADMALCSHLAFWTQNDPQAMESLWLASPLGQRKKTQERKDYRDRTIQHAIDNTTETYTPAFVTPTPEELDLLFVTKGKYTLNTENICRVLRHDFKGQFRFDTFKNVFEINTDGTWRSFEGNSDAVNVLTKISVLYSFFQKVGKDMVYDAIIKVAKENTIDSAKDFITNLKWDNVNRLNAWLTHTYGVEDSEYHQKVGSNWLKGLVKRIVNPGCKFDYVLVLEGEQGSKKSTSLSVLGRDWYVETTMSTDSKDFFMQFEGKAIIEFSEGETLNRTEIKRMKAIITTQSDKYRPPYERVSRDFPRRCVFAMTTNQDEYLKDETGNRRWLPVKCMKPEADVEWLENNREQLFAEAYHRLYTLKETIFEFPKEETLEAQYSRRIHDPNESVIASWYFDTLTEAQRDEGITLHQVYRDALHGGFATSPMKKYDEMAIANILRLALKLIKKQTMQRGIRMVRWYDGHEKSPLTQDSLMSDVLNTF